MKLATLTIPLISMALSLCACPPPANTEGPLPPPVPARGCAAACEHLQQLGCPMGAPTRMGATCEQVCSNAEVNGIDWHTGCLATAPSCSVAGACYRHSPR